MSVTSSGVDLGLRDTTVRELMDDPECDPGRLEATLRRFGTVNRLVAGWATVYRTHLRPHLRDLRRHARVLDLGCGGGDVAAQLSALAARDGLDVTWEGVDPDPRAIAVARTRSGSRVSFRCAASDELRERGDVYDIVISNHVLHHLDAEQLARFCDDSTALATGTVLHSDIARSRTAYLLYAIGITPFEHGTFLRTDGLRSIRRSFRTAELAAALPSEGRWSVSTPAPFRVLAKAAGRA